MRVESRKRICEEKKQGALIKEFFRLFLNRGIPGNVILMVMG